MSYISFDLKELEAYITRTFLAEPDKTVDEMYHECYRMGYRKDRKITWAAIFRVQKRLKRERERVKSVFGEVTVHDVMRRQ